MWHIILNPQAGGGKARAKWADIERALNRRNVPFALYETRYRSHASALAADIIAGGGRRIIGAGGDGTNSEICHGIISQRTVPSSEITYALLPLGRGNDWARTHGFSPDPDRLADRIAHGGTYAQDVGIAEFRDAEGRQQLRYFVNVAGMAYDGFLVQTSEQTRTLIPHGLHYQWMILRCLAAYEAPAGEVFFNGKSIRDRFYLVNVGICKYSGGGMQLVPHAVPDDGLLALMVVKKVPKWEVILQTPRFYKGTLGKHWAAGEFQATEVEVRHTGPQPIWLEVDGEFIGYSPVRFGILPGSLHILGGGPESDKKSS